MASICGGTLALLDAGVPLTEPAAGVAVGLITRQENANVTEHKVLLDILGLEDYLGDMDFKLGGTRSGITTLQSDVKIPGLPYHIIAEAMKTGRKGINDVLDIMSECRDSPNEDRTNLPLTEVFHVPVSKRSRFVGPGGLNLKRILNETGVQVSRSEESEGSWRLFAPNRDALGEAKEMIGDLIADDSVPEFELGAIVTVKILEIREKSILVELHPNMDPVLMHVSQLSATKVRRNCNILCGSF